MKLQAKLTRNEVNYADGGACLILHGDKQDATIALPLDAVQTQSKDTCRGAATLDARKARVRAGEWMTSCLLSAERHGVTTFSMMHGGPIAPVHGTGTPTKIGYALDPYAATQIGLRSISEAEKAAAAPRDSR